jgi:ABC-type multidrug transport system permease subunit
MHLYMDMSNAVIGYTLLRQMVYGFQKFMYTYLGSSTHYNPNAIAAPVQIKEVIYGTEEPSMTEFMAPGMIQALIFFAPLALTGFSLIKERREGLLERSFVAGISSLEIVISHLVIQLLVLAVQAIFIIYTVFYIWEIPLLGSLLEAYIICYAQGVTGITFGLLISSLCPDEVSALVVGSGVVFPTWMLCGVFWPIESM